MPQTPRTPTTAAAHYFDDIFSRSAKPSRTDNNRRLRRSSTSRSIGNRSDFEAALNGDAESEDGAHSYEANNRNSETDAHFNNYVSDQLNRVRSRTSLAAYEDEFEAQLDGSNGANGH